MMTYLSTRVSSLRALRDALLVYVRLQLPALSRLLSVKRLLSSQKQVETMTDDILGYL